VERRHRVIARWTWFLLPFGVVPFLLVALLTTQRMMTVAVPMSGRAARRLRIADLVARLCLFAGVVAVLAIVTARPQVSWLVPAGLFAAAALGYVLARLLWVGVDLSYTTARLVHLKRVHPRFAEAVGYGPLEVRDLSVSRLASRRPVAAHDRSTASSIAG
jgi:hypothetical protein